MPDILIAPQRGTSNNPQIFFTGSVQTSASIRMEVLPEGQIAFLGKSGSLFSISDSMVGSLMAVSDISGLPILEVFSDDKVVMGKYNSNALVVTGSNVSIGKSVPNAKFDVSGSVVISGSLSTTSTVSVANASVTLDSTTSTFNCSTTNINSSTIVVGNNSTDVVGIANNTMYFNGTGNVGIGTTSPSQKLEVGNFLDAVTNKITVSARYEYEPEFNFRLGQSGTGYDWIGAVISSGDDGNYNGKISFKTANASRDTPTTKMVIKASGNVGIGTTTPTGRLQIHNASGNTIAVYKDSGGAAIALGSTTGPTNYALIESINGGGVRFYTGNGTQTEKVRIDVNGNVGIGTAAPRAALDVTGNIIQSWTNNQLNVAQYLTGTQYKMGLESDSNNRVLYIQNQDADNVPTRASIQFRTGSTPSTVVTIQQNGNVGIGASSPNAKLQVNGDVMADNVFNPFLLMGA